MRIGCNRLLDMNSHARVSVRLLALALILCFTLPACTPEPTDFTKGQVIRVIDGDTIKVRIGGKEYSVRYIGIDTPETVAPGKPVQPYGPEATAKNKELVGGKTVRLEKDVSETDQYGRLLRYVYVGDLFVNKELVRLGYARQKAYPPDTKYQDDLIEAERQAGYFNEIGIWSQENWISYDSPELGYKVCYPFFLKVAEANPTRIRLFPDDGASAGV